MKKNYLCPTAGIEPLAPQLRNWSAIRLRHGGVRYPTGRFCRPIDTSDMKIYKNGLFVVENYRRHKKDVKYIVISQKLQYVLLGIAILCNKTVYYMGVRVMQWDNFTVVQGYFFMGTSGFSMKPEGRRPEGFIEATSAHKKVPLYYGKIVPPHYSHPHIVYSFIT